MRPHHLNYDTASFSSFGTFFISNTFIVNKFPYIDRITGFFFLVFFQHFCKGSIAK